MTERVEGNPEVRVDDRRRFDPDGTARAELEETDARPAEPAAPRGPGANVELERLRAELEASRRRVDELARGVQALTQDQDDFKQRLSRERDRMLDVERGRVALALVEAGDELERALEQGDDGSVLFRGVQLIREKVSAKLESSGVQRLALLGSRFDPNLAEAVDLEVTGDATRDHEVLLEVRGGYLLNGRVIRPARVRIAKYVPPARA